MNAVVAFATEHLEWSRVVVINAGAKIDDAGDIVSDAVWKVLKRDPQDVENIKGYWTVCLKNAVVEFYRKESLRKHLSIESIPGHPALEVDEESRIEADITLWEYKRRYASIVNWLLAYDRRGHSSRQYSSTERVKALRLRNKLRASMAKPRPKSRGVNHLKTHCPYGHPYNAENTYYTVGVRQCRACKGFAGTIANREKERCPKGHAYHLTKRGNRACLICDRASGGRHRAHKRLDPEWLKENARKARLYRKRKKRPETEPHP